MVFPDGSSCRCDMGHRKEKTRGSSTKGMVQTMKIIIWLLSTLLGVCVGTGLIVSILERSLSSFLLAVAMICALALVIMLMIDYR